MSRAGTLARAALILVPAAFLLWAIVSVTAAGVFRASNPELALRFQPLDARANAASAKAMVVRGGARMLGTAQQRARAALARDPTAVDAISTLGIIASLQGRNDLADRRFRHAERMSRRDLVSQLWLIERNVQANDIAGALRHYHIALSTSVLARQQLVPILISASSDRAIVGPLRSLLRTRPIWRNNFIERLISEGADPGAMVAVTKGILDHRTQPDRGYLNTLLGRLVQMGAYGRAWEAWSDASRGEAGSTAGLRDGEFRMVDGLPPFHWVYSTEPGLLSERRPRETPAEGFALHLPASNRAGETATQLLRLSAGRHLIAATVGNVAGEPESRPHLSVRCAGAARAALLDLSFPSAGSSGETMRASISVPEDCPFQWLAIHVRGNLDGESADSPWIGSIEVR